jgi:two-component system response regulator AtoC
MRGSIFVTDDDPVIRSTVIERLSRRRYMVAGFDSGEALLTAIDCIIPDLILLDLKMPGLSGLDTLKAVRLKSSGSLIIMLTAYGTIQDAVDAMKLGANDFIVKTVDLRGLDQAVDRALGIAHPAAVSPL